MPFTLSAAPHRFRCVGCKCKSSDRKRVHHADTLLTPFYQAAVAGVNAAIERAAEMGLQEVSLERGQKRTARNDKK